MGKIKTIKVKLGDDFMIINECDFDEKKHDLVEGETKPKKVVLVADISIKDVPEMKKALKDAGIEIAKLTTLKEQHDLFHQEVMTTLSIEGGVIDPLKFIESLIVERDQLIIKCDLVDGENSVLITERDGLIVERDGIVVGELSETVTELSKDIHHAQASTKIKEMTTIDEINAFTAGETRPFVLTAVETRITELS